MKLIVYTIPYEVRNETQKVNRLFEEGLECLHLRKPFFSASSMTSMLKKIDSQFHNKIVLHSHYHLALSHDIKGIHLSPPNFFRKQYANLLKLGKKDLQIASTYMDYRQTNDIADVVDYAMVGPLYTKYSEESKVSHFNEEDLANKVQESSKELIALGGISVEELPFLKQIGFAGAAIQSGIWKTSDVITSFNEYQKSAQFQVAL